MQTLYTLNTIEAGQNISDPVKSLQKQIDATRQLFVYLLYCLTEIARYAETDAHRRASKNLPSAYDLNVNTKISGNEFLWKIIDSSSFRKAVENDKPQLIEDTAKQVKKLYEQLKETPEYKTYTQAQGREKKSEKDIITFIFNSLMLPSEEFTSHIEEHFTNWDDDAEMMEQLVQNFLNFKGTQVKFNYKEATDQELKEIVKKFSKDAQKTTNNLIF